MRSLFVFLLVSALYLTTAFIHHAINITVTDIALHGKKFGIKVKFFTDDLHSSLEPLCSPNIDIENATVGAARKCIDKYITERLSVSVNGIKLGFRSKGAIMKNDVIILEYEADYTGALPVNSVKVKNTLLFEGFPEQKNIVNLHLNNTIKVLEHNNGGGEEVREASY